MGAMVSVSAMGDKPKVFTREATGLVREVGAWPSFMATWALVTGGVPILWVSLMYTAPGANWPLAYLIAFLPSLLLAGLYTIVGISLPRSGSDYVFVTRTFSPAVGFVNNWGVAIAFMLNGGIFMYFGTQYLAYLFGGLGAFYNSPALISFGGSVTQPVAAFAVSVVFLVISALIAMLRPRYAWGTVFWVGLISIVSAVIMIVTLGMISLPHFAQSFDKFMGNPNAYQAVISQGGVAPSSGFVATAAALSFTWFAFTWYNLPVTWSGEMKNVKRSMPIAILGSLGFIFAYYALFALVSVHAFGQNFLTNWSALAASGNEPISAIGNFIPFFALLVYHNPIIFVVMFLALWLSNFVSFPALIISQTRYVFAWAFDRILPDRFAQVNEKVHTPLNAMFTAVLIMVVGAGLVALLPNSSEFTSLAFDIFTFGFIVPSLAGLIFPFTKKEIYENAFVAKRKLGLPLISWLGLGSAVYLVYSTYLEYISGSLPVNGFTALLYGAIYVAGALIFATSYLRTRTLGIPLSMVFKEIPPE
jgi:amino acid transporter